MEALFVDGSVAEKASFEQQTIWKQEAVTSSLFTFCSTSFALVVVSSHFVDSSATEKGFLQKHKQS